MHMPNACLCLCNATLFLNMWWLAKQVNALHVKTMPFRRQVRGLGLIPQSRAHTMDAKAWEKKGLENQSIARVRSMLHSTQKSSTLLIRKRDGCMVVAYANNRTHIPKYPKLWQLMNCITLSATLLGSVARTWHDHTFNLCAGSYGQLADPLCSACCAWNIWILEQAIRYNTDHHFLLICDKIWNQHTERNT
jgi:hypothetical protein